jgi:FdhD protein
VSSHRPASEGRVKVVKVQGDTVTRRKDRVVTEEPMEIRLVAGRQRLTVAVTMRTPGNDFELAAGFLFGEGVVTDADQIVSINYCRDEDLSAEQLYNVVTVELRDPNTVDLTQLQRHFQMSSACGVCGKANIEAIQISGVRPMVGGPVVPASVVTSLPQLLSERQSLFSTTGGLHAAALFDGAGRLLISREDVGRHNAVDKLVGRLILDRKVPAGDAVLMVSGRTSFEIAQKTVTAGIPILCSVSAPSSLAIEVAQSFGLTLIGFVRDDRFNVYSGEHRIEFPATA